MRLVSSFPLFKKKSAVHVLFFKCIIVYVVMQQMFLSFLQYYVIIRNVKYSRIMTEIAQTDVRCDTDVTWTYKPCY